MKQGARRKGTRRKGARSAPRVHVVVRLEFELANIIHDLVLALSRDLRAREDDLDRLPLRIVLDLAAHKVAEVVRNAFEELRSRGDAVGVEDVPLTSSQCKTE